MRSFSLELSFSSSLLMRVSQIGCFSVRYIVVSHSFQLSERLIFLSISLFCLLDLFFLYSIFNVQLPDSTSLLIPKKVW